MPCYYVWDMVVAQHAHCEGHRLSSPPVSNSFFTLLVRRPCWDSTHASLLHCSIFICKAPPQWRGCSASRESAPPPPLSSCGSPASAWLSSSLIIITKRNNVLAVVQTPINSVTSVWISAPQFQIGLITLPKGMVIMWINGGGTLNKYSIKHFFFSTRQSDKVLPSNILLSISMNKTWMRYNT